MTADPERPYLDPLAFSDLDLHVYEAIATLEYLGRPAARSEIAAAAEIDEDRLDRTLDELERRGLLIRSDSPGEPAYEPARRGWSRAPDVPRGPQGL
jgi:DNA-binding MarR family transcriptional regulator